MAIWSVNKQLVMLIAVIAGTITGSGCSAGTKPVRPLPTDDILAYSVMHIFPMSASEVYPFVVKVLENNFPIRWARGGNEEDIKEYGKYGGIDANYVYYKVGRRKYRKQCHASVHIIPGYPDYSTVNVGCDVARWESRFNFRCNFFDWKWDWGAELRSDLYLAEDMLELIREEAGLEKDEIIRLRDNLPEHDEILPLIKEYEERRKNIGT